MLSTVIETVGDLAYEVRELLNGGRRWLYRGQSDARWLLLPSVHRGYLPQQERFLTNEFRVRARSRHPSCPLDHDYPGWLALMQHYGLPTRLLDWTYSPMVAAFFAVHPDYAGPAPRRVRDACIWALSAGELNESQGFEPLIFPLDAASYQPLIVPAFKNREELDTIGVAMAIEHDSRIQLQQAAFTVHSARTPLDRLPGAAQLLRRLVIPGSAVHAFCEELALLGIRKSNLFPDLAALTSELRATHPPHYPSMHCGWLHEPDKENRRMNAQPQNHNPTEPDDRGLEDLGVTRPVPMDRAPAEPDEQRDDNASLEDLNLTQPAAPPVRDRAGPRA